MAEWRTKAGLPVIVPAPNVTRYLEIRSPRTASSVPGGGQLCTADSAVSGPDAPSFNIHRVP